MLCTFHTQNVCLRVFAKTIKFFNVIPNNAFILRSKFFHSLYNFGEIRCHMNIYKMKERIIILIFFTFISKVTAPMAGTFFWKPRLGLDLSVPTTETTAAHKPSRHNIQEGLVVLVDGYTVGMTVVALTVGLSSASYLVHLNPISGYFYTNAYRWGLRYASLLPTWLSGGGGNFCDTHKVWKRRFYYMEEFVPKWMRYLLPYVKKDDWEKEEKELKLYKRWAESAFGKYYRYPTKQFNDYQARDSSSSDANIDST